MPPTGIDCRWFRGLLQFEGVDAEIRALVPRKTLLEILKLIGDQELLVGFGRDENHLFFSVGDRRLVSRVLAGQFPNYEMVIPRDNDKNVTASTKALLEAIRRAAVMSDEKLRAVRLSATPGSLELTASSADAGEAREVMPVEYRGSRSGNRFQSAVSAGFSGRVRQRVGGSGAERW